MSTCCVPVFTIPGPVGPEGPPCTPCADGIDAFTLLDDAAFLMPGYGADQVTDVLDNRAFGLLQPVFLQSAGFMQVTAVNVNGTGITLRNLADGADLYPDNAAPGTAIPDQSKLSPAGLQGPQGSSAVTLPVPIADGGTGAITAASARTNLGLGSMAVQAAGAVAITGGSITGITDLAVADGGTGASTAAGARTNLGLGTIATQAANAVAITGGVITGITDLAIADGGTGASTAAAARANLNVLSGYGLLGSVTALDLNIATNDTSFTVLSSRYRIDKVTLESPSAAVTTATVGLFTLGGGGGVPLCADQAVSGTLTGTSKFMDLVTQAIVGTDERTEATLYARVGTAEGAARTVNLKLYGFKYD